MQNEILTKLNSISDDFEKAIQDKCTELGYDKNKGVISLEESFINLNSIRENLQTAISGGKLSEFPISLQKEITEDLQNAIKFGTEIVNGTDSIVNFVDSVEALNSSLWRYGFYRISTEELELAKRLNKIKHLEVELQQKREALEALLSKQSAIEGIEAAISGKSAENQTLAKSLSENLEKSTKIVEQLSGLNTNAEAILKTIGENETESETELGAAKESKKTISSLQDDIEVFFKKIDGYQKKIDDTTKSAESTVSKNIKDTSDLIAQLNGLESKIKTQIEKATGFTLFHSFQTRQGEIVESKKFWAKALGVLVIASLVATIILGFTTKNIDMWFYLKLSLSIPIIYAITFVNLQFSRERRLEEEYAFKSNISISLVPFKGLVESAIDINDPESKKKYSDFLISSIEKVFTSPTNHSSIQHDSDDPVKVFGHLEKVVSTLVKPLQPLIKAMK